MSNNYTQHGLTLRGGSRWPDSLELAVAGLVPMPQLLAGKTTSQREAEAIERLEMRGDWSNFPEWRQQLTQDTYRANLTDDQVAEYAEAKRLESLYPGSNFEVDCPPFDASMDTAIDDLVQEECAEVIQAISKVRRFGLVNHITKVNNKSSLEEEIGQLLATIERLYEAWGLDLNAIRKASADKFKAIEKWAPYYERNKQD